ncbi:hypothetical protein [Alkalihalobacterium alkalinitrilicum]|uniref:hypothetical protein n=1 Tax=Alkalihalobacterium alkalinitrilicum TaxID=427920 RepID=UPI000994996B|nr:hypothetical protein [Alkalihalobacterium alkalinitrilicum]
MKDLDQNDLEIILKWRNSNRIINLMYRDTEITMSEHEQGFQRVTKDKRYLVKLLVYENRRLGLVNFADIDRMNNRCYWGFHIGDLGAPRESGTMMGLLALNLIFEKMGLRKSMCRNIGI